MHAHMHPGTHTLTKAGTAALTLPYIGAMEISGSALSFRHLDPALKKTILIFWFRLHFILGMAAMPFPCNGILYVSFCCMSYAAKNMLLKPCLLCKNTPYA